MSGARPYEDMPRSVIRELMRAGDTQVPHPPADATRLVHACWQVAVICMLDEVEDRPGLREVGSQLLAIRDLPHLHDVISGVDPSSIGGPVPKQEHRLGVHHWPWGKLLVCVCVLMRLHAHLSFSVLWFECIFVCVVRVSIFLCVCFCLSSARKASWSALLRC